MCRGRTQSLVVEVTSYRGTIGHQKKKCELKKFWVIIYLKKAWAEIINASTRAKTLKDSLRYDELLALCDRQLSGCNLLRGAAGGF